MSTVKPSPVPIGGSNPDEDALDVCAFCPHLLTVHMEQQTFQKQELDGSMADGNRKGRYCVSCQKMCWR